MIYHKHAWLLATSLALSVNIDTVLGHQEGVREHEGNVVEFQGVIKEKTSDEVDGDGSNLRGHGGEDDTNESWPHERRKTKGEKSKKNAHSKSSKSSKKKDKDASKTCDANYCEAKIINLGSMKTCLKDNFNHLSNLYFPEDGEGYLEARQTAYSISRFPAAVVYVEDVDEVKAAMACAVDNGYKVSARGGNHSYQGIATMDGYVVIDMGRTCKTEEFVIDKNDQGPHILEGSKYIGTMKGQAGCTNAVMLAMGHKHFQDEGGMTLIGSCPSVGITGFVLGGGGGDVSPYVGYGVDIVKEFQIVLYDGTVVKASEDENTDLYWASRGGGGGNGIITHLTYKVVQAPKQKLEEEQGKKFTVFRLPLLFKPDSFEKAAARIQEWFYDADPLITGKFGGTIDWVSNFPLPNGTTTIFGGQFIYLGSWREAIEDLQATGLLDDDLFTIVTAFGTGFPRVDASLVENYEVLCDKSPPCIQFEGIPGAASGPILPVQFDTYAEAEAFKMCAGGFFDGVAGKYFEWSYTSGDFCKDLGIDDDKCEDKPSSSPGISIRVPKSCIDKDVIDAMLEAAGDPTSFMNSHGPSPELLSRLAPELNFTEATNTIMEMHTSTSMSGASMFPRFDDAFFAKLLNETTERANHLQHGAALQVHPDDTAFPWRNAAFMVEYGSIEGPSGAIDFLSRMLEGGYTPQGYYAYLSPSGMKNWRSYFFDDHWHKLTEIRAKYDPKDVFGKPLTIESIGE